jgi:hypothetical protein
MPAASTSVNPWKRRNSKTTVCGLNSINRNSTAKLTACSCDASGLAMYAVALLSGAAPMPSSCATRPRCLKTKRLDVTKITFG